MKFSFSCLQLESKKSQEPPWLGWSDETRAYRAVTDADTGQAAGISQSLFYVGHSIKTLLSSNIPSQSAKIIERTIKHKEERAWAPAPLQMGWPGKQWMKPRKNPGVALETRWGSQDAHKGWGLAGQAGCSAFSMDWFYTLQRDDAHACRGKKNYPQ